MKFLHLTTDNRFVNSVPTAFESVAKGQSTYWVIHDGDTSIIKVSYDKKISISEVAEPSLVKQLNDYDIVFLHSLIPEFYTLIYNADDTVKFVWLGWGFDFYDLLLKRLTLQKTTSLIGGQLKAFLKEFKKKYITKTYQKKIETFPKIKYFCPVLPQEYDLLSNRYQTLPPYFEWNYGAIDPDLIPSDQMDKTINGNNILLGNSATASNNHLELFDVIKKIDCGDRDIIVPLSYGEDRYREKIISHLENGMTPITDFIKRSDYMAMLQACSIVLMNHRRQQAFGTIVIMLHMGAKLYLRSKNPLYPRLKEWGVTVFAIEDLEQDQSNFLKPITQEQADKNREVVADYYSLEHYCERTEKLIQEVIRNG